MKKKFILFILAMGIFPFIHAQETNKTEATFFSSAAYVHEIPPISSMKDLEPPSEEKHGEERMRGANKVVPGKGLPHGDDPLVELQKNSQRGGDIEPIITFDANSSSSLQDPTGAIGPNHYVNAWNSGFRIYDTEGNPLTGPASLATITFPGETLGDPCVIYDRYADRFIIMQFSNSPNGILVSVCQGSDPVNDGWYAYRFNTGSFPDYEKISVWSDGYYVTSNKDSGSAGSSEVVYALERDEMLEGNDAQFIGFPLPGIATSGFYSPAGFNANGPEAPPEGSAPIVYMQDDSWFGVSEDHLKIWNVDVDWNDAPSSTISGPQELPTTPFEGVFDGGSFSNLEQPDGNDIDALQATVMYMAQYRRFADHNACVLNWVVDTEAGFAEQAGVRWVELRQDSDGDPWTIYQEGTYTQPEGLHAFCGSICMDADGNIGLGYTVVSEDVFPSIRFTGRYSSDPLGTMTVPEGVIGNGTHNDPSFRYGDYGQMTIDPVDDKTFWHIGEYFVSNFQRTSRAGAFKLAPDLANDVGVIDITAPTDGTLSADEEITITVRNYGIDSQSDIPVTFQIDGEPEIAEVFAGPIASGENVDYTFSATGDFSEIGTTYTITASTELASDENSVNDSHTEEVSNLEPDDLGVTSIDAPESGFGLTDSEDVTVTIENFGGVAQSDFEVSYSINGETPVVETVNSTLEPTETMEYTFDTQADFNALGDYTLLASTELEGDIDPSNDAIEVIITKTMCQPEADCTEGDGIHNFVLGSISNNSECNSNGYADFSNLSTELARGQEHDMTITTDYGDQNVRAWIDFNDDFSFDFGEMVLLNSVIASGEGAGTYTETLQIEIGDDENLGEHLMRVKTNWNGSVPLDACEGTQFGETEDYTVVVTEIDNIYENIFGESEMIVETQQNNNFTIKLETSTLNEPLLFTVHNIMGQRIVHNWVEPDGNGYAYTLDMSYATPGAYLVRFGNSKGGKVARIVVQ